MNLRRFLPLLFLGAALLFIASPAEAQCEGCSTPCDLHVQCSGPEPGGVYSGCMNVGNCAGCMGWMCGRFAEQDAEEPAIKPFRQQYVLAAITIENRARTGGDVMLAEKRRLTDARPQ